MSAAAVADVRIDTIGAGGEGVGRLEDGRVVFVHRTAPGDLASVEVVESRSRWARARLVRLLELSGDRREPPCGFYRECGGCTLEHITYEAQLRTKSRIVGDALTRIGRLSIEPPEVVASPAEVRYRNRVSFALRRTGHGRVLAGFHALGDPDRIVDVDGRCLLPEESIARVWDRLREEWGRGADRLPAGDRLRITLRSTRAGEVSLLVEGGRSPGRPEELVERVDGLGSIWHRPAADPPVLIAGAPGLPETWGDETFELSGAAFLQVNRRAATLLEDHVAELAGARAGMSVVDAYCGIGLLGRRLARSGARVIGLEIDGDAVAAARTGAPSGMEFRQGAVEALLPGELPADLVILNPPRAGVVGEVTDALRTQPPERIVYVSCNPATLARDLGRLSEVFDVTGLRSFDLFPQTAHVESVVELRRREGGAGRSARGRRPRTEPTEH